MAIFGKRKPIDHGVVGSVIGEDTEFKGEINTKGSVRVSGRFEGRINAAGDVLVSEGSKVVGSIVGSRVVVSGDINGNILANEGLEITKTGCVYGDIAGNSLLVDEGAVYKGKVSMEIRSEAAAPEKAIPSPAGEVKVEKTAEPRPPLYEELPSAG